MLTRPSPSDGTKTKLKARLDAVQPIIEQVCQSMGQVGVSYGVLSRQEVVLARGHGFRDLAAREASDEHTLYNIASCTKAFTATACVMLAREGSLDLEVPVRTYVPELEEAEATLIDLLALVRATVAST